MKNSGWEGIRIAFGTCALIAYHGNISTSWSYCSILRVASMCTSLLDNVTAKVCLRFFKYNSIWIEIYGEFLHRYIQYLCDLSFGLIERPHFTELVLKTINLSPVPLFNRERFDQKDFVQLNSFTVQSFRNGCRPYVDVFNQDRKKIYSTYQEPNKLRSEIIFQQFEIQRVFLLRVFYATDGVCLLPLNIPFIDDLTIHVSHAPLGLSLQAHVRTFSFLNRHIDPVVVLDFCIFRDCLCFTMNKRSRNSF